MISTLDICNYSICTTKPYPTLPPKGFSTTIPVHTTRVCTDASHTSVVCGM